MRCVAVAGILALLLAGCTNDLGRWRNSNRETVPVEDATYDVVWLVTPDGIDAHSSNNTAAFSFWTPDPLTEKRRATQSMKIVADRECHGYAAAANETSVDLMFSAQWRCTAPAVATPQKRAKAGT